MVLGRPGECEMEMSVPVSSQVKRQPTAADSTLNISILNFNARSLPRTIAIVLETRVELSPVLAQGPMVCPT